MTQEFKLIVAGGRSFNDYDTLAENILTLAEHDLSDRAVSIVSGMARGADYMAYHFAKQNGVVCYEFPADWKNLDVPGTTIREGKYGPYNARAGHDRNERMGRFADGLLAFWDGRSTGTKHMIQFMEELEKPVWIVRY